MGREVENCLCILYSQANSELQNVTAKSSQTPVKNHVSPRHPILTPFLGPSHFFYLKKIRLNGFAVFVTVEKKKMTQNFTLTKFKISQETSAMKMGRSFYKTIL